MKKTLAALGIVTYFAMGCVQLLACIKGIQVWFNLPWIVAAFIAFWISYLPILGTIAGIIGARDGWGWSLGFSLAFFLGPFAFFLVAILIGAGIIVLSPRKA